MTGQSGNPLSVGAALGNQDLTNEQQGLLNLIDKLQFAQLDNVKLPQIVVVGDQSAGKSSALEAVTGIPFLREAGACTRFATEIRLRRAKEEKFSVRIIPDKNQRTHAEQDRLRQFGLDVDQTIPFDTILRHAVDQIAPKNVPGRFAAGDILVVEKSGPNMPLLTVVDLPGLVRNPNNDQSADDIEAINDLTDRYMKSSRTIILAVVGGNQDYVQAPVLTKAREFDPTGGRTIGVLTKPDLTESIGLEDKFIALVSNKDQHYHFDLGWYVLLNPAPREPGQEWPSTAERKRKEDAFFTTGKWVGPAVYGTYINPLGKSFFPTNVDRKGTPPQKLRARTVEENKRFAERVRTQGQKFHFTSATDLQATIGRKLGKMTKQDFAREEVEQLLQQNTGTEFPMDHNPRLVYTLFQDYSENWSRLAQEHKDNLGVICNEFLGEVIDEIWPHRMREPLRTEFLDPQMKGIMEKAQAEVDVLRQDLYLEVQPYDPEYEERLKRWRAEAPEDSPYTEAEVMLEKMLIHYELAAKTFTSNVITQVVERHLLQGLHTIFSWVKINRMTDETVLAIAAENEVTRNKRIALKNKKAAIEDARDICASLAMRKELRTYGKDESANAEESADEEEPNPLLPSERQRTSPRPPRVVGSTGGIPPKSQRPPSQEERPQTTPRKSNIVTNGNAGPGYEKTFDFGTDADVAGIQSRPRTDPPSFPNAADYYPSAPGAPQHAPPPPPRSDRPRHQTESQYYPSSPPNSVNRPPIPVQEQYPASQPFRTDLNGHQSSNSYPHLNLNGAPTYLNSYSQSSPVHKPQRKSVGATA